MKNKITFNDIARQLNCSKGTVSLALSGSSLVNDDTRSRVVLSALELGYDISKRRISAKKEKIFSMVVNDVSYINTFFWTEIVKAMEKSITERGLMLDLVLFDSQKKGDFLFSLINKKTSGLLVIAECDRKRIEILRKSGLPIVVVDGNNYYGTDCDCVTSSNYISAYNAGRYLVAKGHIRIGFVGWCGEAISFKQRRAGFIDGLTFTDKKIGYCEAIKAPDKESITFSRADLKRLFKKDEHPTALMCANDFTAFKVYDLLTEMGFSVPDDVSLIGYDNISMEHPMSGKLTTFDIPKKEMGTAAIELLSERIANPDKPKKLVEVFAPMIERESVKDLNERKKK